ncbi:hypothetical protein KY348_02190 [Candidatus Woesearchaeota archaeon]|nr:hypothetical protein [Candidatus Woesearchaeota archaeon]
MLKRKKGQSSTEFILVLGAVFLISLGALIMIQKQVADSKKQKTYVKTGELGNLILAEVQNAKASQGFYSRKFFIPETINENEYLLMHNNSEITIKVEDLEYILFLEHNVSGKIRKGWNVIEKQGTSTNYTISVNN